MIGRGILFAVLVLAGALLAAPSHAAVPAGAEYSEAYFESGDGTRLHADVIRPEGAGRTPVILHVTPYNGHADPYAGRTPLSNPPPAPWSAWLRTVEDGYTLVVVDLPGFGASDGCWDNAGPREQAAVKAAVEWSATRSWSTGRVGMVGLSYPGLTGVMGLATQPEGLAAVAALSPWADVYAGYYTDGLPHWVGPFTVPAGYTAETQLPGTINDSAGYHDSWARNEPNSVCPGTYSGVFDRDPAAAYWRERDILDRVAESDVPVLASQGFLDFNVLPNQIAQLYPRLHNPRGLWLGQFGHELPPGEGAMLARIRRFFAEHLKGQPPAQPDPAVVLQEAPSLRWRTEEQWPPADADAYALGIRPGSYRDVRGNVAGDNVWEYSLPTIPASAAPVKGQGTWTITKPLPSEAHLSGVPRVEATAIGPAQARFVALLYDISPDGSAFLITRGAAMLRSGAVDIELHPQDWRLAAGHRIGLLISGSDDSYWVPTEATGAEVEVESGSLTLPLLRYLRDEFVEGKPGPRWDAVKRPIRIDQGTIDGATVSAEPPPPQEPRAAAVDSGGKSRRPQGHAKRERETAGSLRHLGQYTPAKAN